MANPEPSSRLVANNGPIRWDKIRLYRRLLESGRDLPDAAIDFFIDQLLGGDSLRARLAQFILLGNTSGPEFADLVGAGHANSRLPNSASVWSHVG